MTFPFAPKAEPSQPIMKLVVSMQKCEPLRSYYFDLNKIELACDYVGIKLSSIAVAIQDFTAVKYVSRLSLAEFLTQLHNDSPTRFAFFLSYTLQDIIPKDNIDYWFSRWGDWNKRYFETFARDLRVLGYELEIEGTQGPVVRPSTSTAEEEKILDSLDNMLSKIDPKLLLRRRGARSALLSEEPDSDSQAMSSSRELLTGTINTLADGATRKERVRKILQGSDADSDTIESIAQLVDSLYALQSKGTHAESGIERALFAVKICEDTLYFVLKLQSQFSKKK